MVITTLTKEAFPLLRYRTRDITSLNYAPCKCGRTIARMNRFQGRSDDMLIIRGVNVFPSQIESVLMETPGVAPHYQLIVDREGQLDTLEVQVEVDEATFSDEVKQMQALAQSIQRKIKDYFTVSVKVKLVEPQTIPRSEGKAKRVIDKRQVIRAAGLGPTVGRSRGLPDFTLEQLSPSLLHEQSASEGAIP